MRIIPEQYECDICHRRYTTKEEAMECEAKKAPIYPIGMIFGNNEPEAFYESIVFAIAENGIDRHWNQTSCWACRGGKLKFVGDSLGKQMCGSGNFTRLGPYDAKVDRTLPEFESMRKWLISQKIVPTIWDGEKVAPI